MGIAKMKYNVTSFKSAQEVFERHPNSHGIFKLGHNTEIWQNTNVDGDVTDIEIRYHGSAIVRYYPNGNIDICAFGYVGPTTLQRISLFTPRGVYVNQHKFAMCINGTPVDEYAVHTLTAEFQAEALKKHGEMLQEMEDKERTTLGIPLRTENRGTALL